MPLPQMIQNQIMRDSRMRSRRTIIRDTLELIETEIRFQTVRLFSCYINLLVYAFEVSGMSPLVARIPALPLYLEIGASDKTMISFISLGLSRVAAKKLADIARKRDLDVEGVLQWLRGQDQDKLGLSPLLLEEVKQILATAFRG
jgi:hypothetical protein